MIEELHSVDDPSYVNWDIQPRTLVGRNISEIDAFHIVAENLALFLENQYGIPYDAFVEFDPNAFCITFFIPEDTVANRAIISQLVEEFIAPEEDELYCPETPKSWNSSSGSSRGGDTAPAY